MSLQESPEERGESLYQGSASQSLPGSIAAWRPDRRGERVAIFHPEVTRGEWRTHGRAAAVVTTRNHIGGAVRGRLSAAQHRRVGITLAYVTRLLHRQYVHATI